MDDGSANVTEAVIAADGTVGSALKPGGASEPSVLSPYVSVVLPCYNEQGHIAREVDRICAAMDNSGYPYELLAFDDASTDQTLAALLEIAPRYPAMRIVHF